MKSRQRSHERFLRLWELCLTRDQSYTKTIHITSETRERLRCDCLFWWKIRFLFKTNHFLTCCQMCHRSGVLCTLTAPATLLSSRLQLLKIVEEVVSQTPTWVHLQQRTLACRTPNVDPSYIVDASFFFISKTSINKENIRLQVRVSRWWETLVFGWKRIPWLE